MLRRVQGELLKKYVTFFLLFGSFILWFLYLYLTYGLIENSTISLEIDKLFSLDAFSFLAIGCGSYFSDFRILKYIDIMVPRVQIAQN